MNAWVLLIDLIEGSRRRVLPPAALRGLLKGLGVRQVKAAAASGDAVFSGVIDARAFGGYVAEMISAEHKTRARALVLSRESFADIVGAWPWPGVPNDPERGQVWFLHRTSPASPAAVAAAAGPGARAHLTAPALYHHAPGGLAQSALPGRAEALLGVPGHARDLAAIARLQELLATLRDD